MFFLEELSDEYQTDYDEEAVESALSDYEAFNHGSEHTEGEETVDTVETVRHKYFIPSLSKGEWKGDGDYYLFVLSRMKMFQSKCDTDRKLTSELLLSPGKPQYLEWSVFHVSM